MSWLAGCNLSRDGLVRDFDSDLWSLFQCQCYLLSISLSLVLPFLSFLTPFVEWRMLIIALAD